MNCFYQYIGNTACEARMASKSCFENGQGKAKLRSKGVVIKGYMCVCGWSYQKCGASNREIDLKTKLHAKVCKVTSEEKKVLIDPAREQFGRLFLEENTATFKDNINTGEQSKLRKLCEDLKMCAPWECGANLAGLNGVKGTVNRLTIRDCW